MEVADTVFAYVVEDEVFTGTLREYARDCEQAHYSDALISPKVYYPCGDDLVSLDVKVDENWTEDDYIYTRIYVEIPSAIWEGSSDCVYATIRIDGRA